MVIANGSCGAVVHHYGTVASGVYVPSGPGIYAQTALMEKPMSSSPHYSTSSCKRNLLVDMTKNSNRKKSVPVFGDGKRKCGELVVASVKVYNFPFSKSENPCMYNT